ncbi:hypothetical protein [Burkholderia sp. Bp8963]|nr:hypothetical protein [Burkholderia sp. Bp8963]
MLLSVGARGTQIAAIPNTSKRRDAGSTKEGTMNARQFFHVNRF